MTHSPAGRPSPSHVLFSGLRQCLQTNEAITATILGWPTRRLAYFLRRKSLKLEQLQDMIKSVRREDPRVSGVFVNESSLRWLRDGQAAPVSDSYYAAPGFQAGSTTRLSQVLTRIRTTRSGLERCRASTSADRLLLLRAQSGRLGKHPTGTVLAEAMRPGVEFVAPDWQSQPLDTAYMGMISALVDTGHIRLERQTLPAGYLKDLYARQNLEGSHVVRVAEVGQSLWYVSAVYRELPAHPDILLDLAADLESTARSLEPLLSEPG